MAIVLILAVWQFVSSAGLVPKFMLPSPLDVAAAFINDFSLLMGHAKTTLTEALPAKMLAEAKILAVKIAVFIIFIFLSFCESTQPDDWVIDVAIISNNFWFVWLSSKKLQVINCVNKVEEKLWRQKNQWIWLKVKILKVRKNPLHPLPFQLDHKFCIWREQDRIFVISFLF